LLWRSCDRVGSLGAVTATGGSGSPRSSASTQAIGIRRRRGTIEAELSFATGALLGEVVRKEDTGGSLHVTLMSTTVVLTGVGLDVRHPWCIGWDRRSTSTIHSRIVGSVQRAMHVVHLKTVVIPGSSQGFFTQVSLRIALDTSAGGTTATNLVDVTGEFILEGEQMVAPNTSPPGRLIDNSEFTVEHLAALTS
jgi:hypothetical protein